MLNDNISFLEEFIGSKWLRIEFEKINIKTPLKGAGTLFEAYHPWVHYMYEIEYLLRRATIENHEGIIMGRYHYIMNNAGMLLKHNLNYITNKKDAQMRLRSPKKFYDFVWELETRTMLSKRGSQATFVDPKCGSTYDGTVIICDRPIPFECKNKVLDNERYNTNMVFSQILANKLEDVTSIQNKIIQIEYDSGRLEDIRTIVSIIRSKFDIYDYQSFLGRYKVRTLKNLHFDIPPQYLINKKGINSVIEINSVKKSELHLNNAPSRIVKTKLLFKIPEQIYKLSNLNNVLKKANSQLSSGGGGLVFLHVPYKTFETAKKEIKNNLARYYSNIFAVKLISYDVNSTENGGVKIDRLEDLILSETGKTFLMQKEIDFLNQPMSFSKYAR